MSKFIRSCIQSLLKFANSIIGMVGMAMILYSFWMIRFWYSHSDGSQPGFSASAAPWFIYTFLGLGICLCLITCLGHIAAEIANGHFLSCYVVLVFLFVLLEAGITADVFLNSHWEEDFPKDPSRKFDEFKDLVRSNFEMCKWMGLVIVATQALSIFLAMVLRTTGPDLGKDYDSDDDYTTSRLPLLKHPVLQPPWKIHEKGEVVLLNGDDV